MSNHYSAANLRFPGDDARLDLTDLFVFASPDDPERTVLIIDVNPYTTGMSAMPPFLMKRNSTPTGSIGSTSTPTKTLRPTPRSRSCSPSSRTASRPARFASPPVARPARQSRQARCSSLAFPVGSTRPRETVVVDQVRLFIGVRSDPFFADADGSFHGFKWTGQDAFADRNVLSIALEVPNDMLSTTRRSGYGPRSMYAATTRSSKWTAADTRRSTRSSTRTTSRTSTTSDSRSTTSRTIWSSGPKLLRQNGYSPDRSEGSSTDRAPDILRIDRDRPLPTPTAVLSPMTCSVLDSRG